MTEGLKSNALAILSWNINDASDRIEGPKANDIDFGKILKLSKNFCLQETKQSFSYPDYKCFNSLRKDSRSGGLCIGVHRSLEDKIKEIIVNSSEIQAISLQLKNGSCEEKITIINVYDSPEHGSYKKRKKNSSDTEFIPTIDKLMEFVASRNDLGEVFLAGDFNARTSSENHQFACDQNEAVGGLDWRNNGTSHPVVSTRTSKDSVTNKRGKDLIDHLACTNLSILNGCTIGDILGEFTYVGHNGKSVVDYVATSQYLKDKVDSFKVLELTKFSDHKPCLCSLNINSSILSSDDILKGFEDVPINYKSSAENKSLHHNFLSKQIQPENVKKLTEICQTFCKNKSDVIDLNSRIVGLYQNIADEVMPRKGNHTRKSPGSNTNARKRTIPKTPWFDVECINGKRELKRLAKCYGKSPSNEDIRESYYNSRKCYRKLIKTKKESFFLKLCSEIEDGKDIN